MKNQFNKTKNLLAFYKFKLLKCVLDPKKVIVCSGMPRSGSTWQYNAVRLLMIDSGERVAGFFWWDLPFFSLLFKWQRRGVWVIKVHKHFEWLENAADLIFYSYRDVRDVVASLKRKDGKDVDQIIRQVERMTRGSYVKWINCADDVMRYETMIEDPDKEIEKIVNVLCVKGCDVSKFSKDIDALSYQSQGRKTDGINFSNMLHVNHITNGKHQSWKTTLSDSDVDKIEKNMNEWLSKNGYLSI